METKSIKKILIANRGEIAIRIIKTCKELGIAAVAVYSDVDHYSPHTRYADESYNIGAAPAKLSYLNAEKIIEIALQTKTDAIHPGYGFLSENADFAQLVEENGLIFIGPKAQSIKLMGDKTAARDLAIKAGIPIVPGTTKPVKSVAEAQQIADELGFPVLLKAAGGGGGKGMRIISSPNEMENGLQTAKSEALSAFKDNRVYIEKYITNPRHIEVQILADQYGNVIHLGERECSIQRRHQKIIEESPSTYLDGSIREQLTQAAISLVKMSGYTNAGTLEFIFDQNKKFYFLEMNTRLQVEHPVTEMRVGFDLVAEQIRIAEGKKLSFTQEDINFIGNSIECRIYAEDPSNNFFPSTGKIAELKVPSGFGIRDDRGVETGSIVTAYYDPLISKLISWGRTREEARKRLSAALSDYILYGIINNIDFCHSIINHPQFVKGEYDTGFIHKYFEDIYKNDIPENIIQSAIIGSIATYLSQQKKIRINTAGDSHSRWKNKQVD
ncbi:MAG: acetyl-CoA carboxylase biotin carboxylase subunit [Ignavibacteriales bacterium]|nr:acetyl-CoA carboxylase biotin carboxylase subunit [Ignavibacteriales bacterium]